MVKRVRRLISIGVLTALLAIPILAAPVTAAEPDRYAAGFPPVGYMWTFQCGNAEVDGTIVVNNEYWIDFFDQNGQWVKSVGSGQLFADLYAPSTGETHRLNISGPAVIFFDPTIQFFSKYLVLGPSIFFGSHYVFYGHADFATGTRVGARIDLCPMVGLPS